MGADYARDHLRHGIEAVVKGKALHLLRAECGGDLGVGGFEQRCRRSVDLHLFSGANLQLYAIQVRGSPGPDDDIVEPGCGETYGGDRKPVGPDRDASDAEGSVGPRFSSECGSPGWVQRDDRRAADNRSGGIGDGA